MGLLFKTWLIWLFLYFSCCFPRINMSMIQACHDIKRVRIKSSVLTKKLHFYWHPRPIITPKGIFKKFGFLHVLVVWFQWKTKVILDKIKAILKSSNRIYSKSPFLKFWVKCSKKVRNKYVYKTLCCQFFFSS